MYIYIYIYRLKAQPNQSRGKFGTKVPDLQALNLRNRYPVGPYSRTMRWLLW